MVTSWRRWSRRGGFVRESITSQAKPSMQKRLIILVCGVEFVNQVQQSGPVKIRELCLAVALRDPLVRLAMALAQTVIKTEEARGYGRSAEGQEFKSPRPDQSKSTSQFQRFARRPGRHLN
jgi:hypothetical protein